MTVDLYIFLICTYHFTSSIILGPQVLKGYEPHAVPLNICELSMSICVYLCICVSVYLCICIIHAHLCLLILCTSMPAHHHPNLIPPPFTSLPAESRSLQIRYIISFTITTMSSSKTIFASIAKLNGQNWHTWSKATEAYLTLEEFWKLVNLLWI